MIDADTLLIAVLSGLGGGLIGTWLQIRHERHEAFRERQLTAADDFSTGLGQALFALGDVRETCLKHGFLDPQQRLRLTDPATGKVPAEIEEALQRAKRAVDEVSARQGRIALLFGAYAPSGRSGQLAIIELRSALEALSGWPRPDLERYRQYARDANRSLDDFNGRALADIRGRPWFSRWRAALWVRRRLRRLRERAITPNGATVPLSDYELDSDEAPAKRD